MYDWKWPWGWSLLWFHLWTHSITTRSHKCNTTLDAFGYNIFPAFKSSDCSNGPVQSEFHFYEPLSTQRNNKSLFYGLSRVYPNMGTHRLMFSCLLKEYTLHMLIFFCICTSLYIYPHDMLVVLEKHSRSCNVFMMTSGDLVRYCPQMEPVTQWRSELFILNILLSHMGFRPAARHFVNSPVSSVKWSETRDHNGIQVCSYNLNDAKIHPQDKKKFNKQLKVNKICFSIYQYKSNQFNSQNFVHNMILTQYLHHS